MSAINAATRDAWQAIAEELSKQRPNPGRRVRVSGCRKRAGKEGTVLRHQVSKYNDVFRYASEAQAHMREMAGRAGFVVLVQPDDNSDPFWIAADKVDVMP